MPRPVPGDGPLPYAAPPPAAAVGAGVWVGLQRLAPGSAPLGAAPFFQPPPAAPAPPAIDPLHAGGVPRFLRLGPVQTELDIFFL